MFQRPAPLLPAFSEQPRPSARDSGRPWHSGSRFPGADDFRPIDRNDRWRVWVAAEALEKRTKQARKHGGVLGHTGLIVLRCLLFEFLNIGSGRLDPSYEAIAEKTNLARDTVIEAVKRLSTAGILEISRRIIRERVKNWCEFAGRVIWSWRTRQTSNAYRVNFPLPVRRELGDLGMPLLRGGGGIGAAAGTGFLEVRAESDKPTETTLVFYPSKPRGLDRIADPGLRASLERIKAMVDAQNSKH
jgi:DNA-binding Lrp family transcriptional regulator